MKLTLTANSSNNNNSNSNNNNIVSPIANKSNPSFVFSPKLQMNASSGGISQSIDQSNNANNITNESANTNKPSEDSSTLVLSLPLFGKKKK